MAPPQRQQFLGHEISFQGCFPHGAYFPVLSSPTQSGHLVSLYLHCSVICFEFKCCKCISFVCQGMVAVKNYGKSSCSFIFKIGLYVLKHIIAHFCTFSVDSVQCSQCLFQRSSVAFSALQIVLLYCTCTCSLAFLLPNLSNYQLKNIQQRCFYTLHIPLPRLS